jgi:hypothetical protein
MFERGRIVLTRCGLDAEGLDGPFHRECRNEKRGLVKGSRVFKRTTGVREACKQNRRKRSWRLKDITNATRRKNSRTKEQKGRRE